LKPPINTTEASWQKPAQLQSHVRYDCMIEPHLNFPEQ